MNMKALRQSEILRLITDYEIDTQEELRARLIELGCDATQATVSRDMRELNIVKVSAGNGKYKYVQQSELKDHALQDKFATILEQAVKSVEKAMNLVVVKAFTGMGSAAGAAIDSLGITGVIGTVAGDDTILLIAKDEEAAGNACDYLKTLKK